MFSYKNPKLFLKVSGYSLVVWYLVEGSGHRDRTDVTCDKQGSLGDKENEAQAQWKKQHLDLLNVFQHLRCLCHKIKSHCNQGFPV
jgi:hypothetical protein